MAPKDFYVPFLSTCEYIRWIKHRGIKITDGIKIANQLALK